MISEEELREHDQFLSTLSPPDVKLHTYNCGLCKEEAWHRAAMESFERGFPEFEDGTSGQQGYANVVRLKFYNKHGDAILPVIKCHVDPKWWLDNRSTLSSGTMKSSIGALVTSSELYLESPIKAKIFELEEKLVGLKRMHKQETRTLDKRRQAMAMAEAELEASISDLKESDTD